MSALKTGAQTIFTKTESSLVYGNSDINFPKITSQLAYEVELVAKIGKRGKAILLNEAIS
ncbi:fumarylacetoacetate hydrolase family protein [Winogradskyella sediminis]|nr:fumarylacetoacetate hydrolase family protein [Winogradskyella sediminis]